MMLLLPFACLILAGSLESSGQQLCTTTADCSAESCCVSFAHLDGRRQIQNSGSCQSLGSTTDVCYVNAVYDVDRSYFERCPCGRSMRCVGTGMIEPPYGEVGVCT